MGIIKPFFSSIRVADNEKKTSQRQGLKNIRDGPIHGIVDCICQPKN